MSSRVRDKCVLVGQAESWMPRLGLSTRNIRGQHATEIVQAALAHGYRHIDTSASARNEPEIGEGIRRSGVPRSEIWVTAKLANEDHKRVADAFAESCRKLDIKYIDLYLMETPCGVLPQAPGRQLQNWSFIDTWREMQKLRRTGKLRRMGVCNFESAHLQELLDHESCIIWPEVNQIEMHPCYRLPKLVALCYSMRIELVATTCLGGLTSPVIYQPAVVEVAARLSLSPQQVLIKWGLQSGWSVLVGMSNDRHLTMNFGTLQGQPLSPNDMAQINAISKKFKGYPDISLPLQIFFGEEWWSKPESEDAKTKGETAEAGST